MNEWMAVSYALDVESERAQGCEKCGCATGCPSDITCRIQFFHSRSFKLVPKEERKGGGEGLSERAVWKVSFAI